MLSQIFLHSYQAPNWVKMLRTHARSVMTKISALYIVISRRFTNSVLWKLQVPTKDLTLGTAFKQYLSCFPNTSHIFKLCKPLDLAVFLTFQPYNICDVAFQFWILESSATRSSNRFRIFKCIHNIFVVFITPVIMKTAIFIIIPLMIPIVGPSPFPSIPTVRDPCTISVLCVF